MEVEYSFMDFGKLTKSYVEVLESEPLWRKLLVSWLGIITASEVSLGGFRIQLYILIQLVLKRN